MSRKPTSVKATVLIAISDDGYWISIGSSGNKTAKSRRKEIDELLTNIGVLPPVKYYEISAQVPVPDPEIAVKLDARAGKRFR